MEKFCNKCFTFGKDAPNLKFAIWRCGHVACAGCVVREKRNVCTVCRIESKVANFDAVFNSTDPKTLYKTYANTVRIKITQNNRMFNYYYKTMADQIREIERHNGALRQYNQQRQKELNELKEKQEKMKRYITFYNRYFQHISINDRQRFTAVHDRPKTPTNSSISTTSAPRSNKRERISDTSFSFLK